MKTNGIIIKFSGAIFISAKEKEVLPLFQQIKTLSINQGKSKLLEVKQYSFPFEFKVPENLPSTMDVQYIFFKKKVMVLTFLFSMHSWEKIKRHEFIIN